MQNEIFDLKLVIINDNNLGFNKNKCFGNNNFEIHIGHVSSKK